MLDYGRGLLLDGGETAGTLFSKLFEATAARMRSLAETGVVRPAQDERIRTAFLLASDLSLVLLRRQTTRVTGTDPLTREELVPWTPTVMDVCTGGIFAAPTTPGRRASDLPPKEGTYR